MNLATVTITCRAPSHEDRPARVALWRVDLDTPADRRAVGGGDPRTSDAVVLVDEQPHPVKAVFGGAAGGPANPPRGEVRHREALTCPLCGLRVEMRAERAQMVRDRLARAGVSDVSLAALAATL